MNSLYTFGLNHHNTPVDIREKVVFGRDNLIEGLQGVSKSASVPEVAIVSTCNRTEVYCGGGDPAEAMTWLAEYHNLDADFIKPYIYLLPEERAVFHAFRVASGLDSMVIGEPQILGQIKDAVKSAEAAGTMGTILHKLFQKTFSVAKKVRSETEIGSHSVSLASIAVSLSERLFPNIRDRKILCIGAGEMVELFASRFYTLGLDDVTFANRSVERAQEMAKKFDGSVITLNDIPNQISRYDIVFCSTASPVPVLGKGTVERAIRTRKHEPVILFDLGVPRDIEPEIQSMDDAFLYSVDDLGKIAKDGVKLRKAAVKKAENIINAGVGEFMSWMSRRKNAPIIMSLRDQMERHRVTEMTRAIKLLNRGESPEKVLEEITRSLVNKLGHGPINLINQAGVSDRTEIARALASLVKKRD
ncbi:MAG: glutamyl-tRNA reductase [Proteobacteria bacterium]|nr:glutamyl-tRNA reductase [Pseudomonadota bacterium]